MAKKSKHIKSNHSSRRPQFKEYDRPTLYCSFCGKSQHDVRKLIAGPNVFACNECAELMVEIVDEQDGSRRIVREIELQPGQVTAVSQILSNFSQFLKDKHPDNTAKVRIEQTGQKIKMVVQTDDGHYDEVEESLEQYALVMTGRLDPADVLDDKIKILDLEYQRNQAQMALQFSESQNKLLLQVNAGLQNENQRLAQSNTELIQHASKQVDLSSGMNQAIIQLLTHSSDLIKKLDEISQRNDMTDNLRSLLNELANKAKEGITEQDRAEVTSIMSEISKESPSVAYEVYDFIKSSVSGVASSLIVKWIEVAPFFAKLLPI